MQKGSKKWFESIANTLGKYLLGIELRDSSESGASVSPPVQVEFVTPLFFDETPEEVRQAAEFSGFRMFHRLTRGSGKGGLLGTVVFGFNDPSEFPSRETVIQVAEEFGLTYVPELDAREDHTSRLSPSLYE